MPYIRNSRHEASRAGRLLTAACGTPVPVRGVVVLVGVDALTIKAEPTDVAVVSRRRLAEWLRSRPTVLRDEETERIHMAARRSSTWGPGQLL